MIIIFFPLFLILLILGTKILITAIRIAKSQYQNISGNNMMPLVTKHRLEFIFKLSGRISMIQIQRTRKTLEEFDIKSDDFSDNNNLYNLHANLFFLNGIRCLYLINDFNYFRFVIYKLTSVV